MSLRLVAGLAAGLAVVTVTAFAVQEQSGREELVVVPLAGQEHVAAEVRAPSPVGRATPDGTGTTRVDPSWLAATAAATGVPEPALRAYATAQLDDVGGCGVGWTTLAGIGWVESQHGTIGGRTLGDDGRSSAPVLGPALDGRGAVAALRSSRTSRTWHGDAVWEHAVGPMQFLASTWATWRTDGDRDGIADPLDIDDAAAATARYLCANGTDLSSGAGWAAAVFSYNHARVYVDQVHAAAAGYAGA